MRRAIRCVVGGVLILAGVGASGALASSAVNWSTHSGTVVCGIAGAIHGTRLDPGTGTELDGGWPGLQCAAQGIPRPRQGVGDPFVQLGQGRAGRARIVDESQDDLISGAPSVVLAPGSVWKRYGITCKVRAASIRCQNGSAHGFTLARGHVHLF